MDCMNIVIVFGLVFECVRYYKWMWIPLGNCFCSNEYFTSRFMFVIATINRWQTVSAAIHISVVAISVVAAWWTAAVSDLWSLPIVRWFRSRTWSWARARAWPGSWMVFLLMVWNSAAMPIPFISIRMMLA